VVKILPYTSDLLSSCHRLVSQELYESIVAILRSR